MSSLPVSYVDIISFVAYDSPSTHGSRLVSRRTVQADRAFMGIHSVRDGRTAVLARKATDGLLDLH